jgi:glycosyltransferase involved in cell wall biosynthesis
MKVALYTLTRERLDYTKHCFGELRSKAGMDFDHFVVDNGSDDGTQLWLEREYQDRYDGVRLIKNDNNMGISVGSNQALDYIGSGYDLIFKMDNDCEVNYDGIIARIVRLYENTPPLSSDFMLSPRVEGIINQPHRARETMLDDVRVGITGSIGGLFHVMRADLYQQFRYDESLPLAQGQDQQVCAWYRAQGGQLGYLEPITVQHYESTEGQVLRYPEYFERKWKEEK